jgi:hypothetical protein
MKCFYETEGLARGLQLAADSICDGIATAVVRAPVHGDHVFRLKATTVSGG